MEEEKEKEKEEDGEAQKKDMVEEVHRVHYTGCCIELVLFFQIGTFGVKTLSCV